MIAIAERRVNNAVRPADHETPEALAHWALKYSSDDTARKLATILLDERAQLYGEAYEHH